MHRLLVVGLQTAILSANHHSRHIEPFSGPPFAVYKVAHGAASHFGIYLGHGRHGIIGDFGGCIRSAERFYKILDIFSHAVAAKTPGKAFNSLFILSRGFFLCFGGIIVDGGIKAINAVYIHYASHELGIIECHLAANRCAEAMPHKHGLLHALLLKHCCHAFGEKLEGIFFVHLITFSESGKVDIHLLYAVAAECFILLCPCAHIAAKSVHKHH